MFYEPQVLLARATAYVERLGLTLHEKILGRGLEGMVFETNFPSAVKVHSKRESFLRELNAYGRLAQYQVETVRTVTVPCLRAFDDNLLLLDMTIVKPPFIVDFAGAQLDQPAAHTADPEMRQHWFDERAEKFGDEVCEVNALLADLEGKYGIYLSDIHPGNIRLR